MSTDLPTRGSLRALRHHYTQLRAPREDELVGRFHATFIGPFWLRLTAGPGLALLGLPGFWGKQLSGYGGAHNLLARRGEILPSLPMVLAAGRSCLDGEPCAELTYPRGSQFPFERVRDELRVVGEGRLIGMTFTDAPLVRRVGLPFLLLRES